MQSKKTMFTPHSPEKIKVYLFVSSVYGVVSTLKKAGKSYPQWFTIDYEPMPAIEQNPEPELFKLGVSIANDYINGVLSDAKFVQTVRELSVLLDDATEVSIEGISAPNVLLA